MPFDCTLTVGEYESVEVPAGRFDTISVHYALDMHVQGATVTIDSLMWVDVATSLAVRNETVVDAMGTTMTLTLEAKDLGLD